VLAGSAAVGARFEAIRAQVLGRERDGAALRAEVSEMRAKMRDNLGSKATAGGTSAEAFATGQTFDLKHDAGGIVDIEFMVQYAVLAWSRQYPELLRFTDNIRILEGLERAGLIASSDVRLLQEAYKAYRAAAHRLALQKQAGSVSGDHFHEERRGVMRIWRELGLA
jgi:glutamate-ammonia-ligase adenylyltransferase